MPKIAETPYKTLPDTRPAFFDTIMEGRSEYYHRTYSLSERWKKITSAIDAIVSSDGEKLFEAKTWRRIFKKGIWGACDKVRFVADPRMKMHEVNTQSLNHYPPLQIKKNQIIGQKDPQPLFAKIQDNLDCITSDELLEGLASCIKELEKRLGNEPFQIGLKHRGQNVWTTNIATQFLSKKQIPTYRVGNDLPLADKSPNLVLFYDASYTESTITDLIKATRFQARDAGFKKFKIYVVVPFVNRQTIKVALSDHSTRNDDENFEVHLITTFKSIKSIKDCLTDAEIYQIMSTGYETFLSNKSLTWLEWSVSNDDELPDFLVKGPTPYLTTHNLDKYGQAS